MVVNLGVYQARQGAVKNALFFAFLQLYFSLTLLPFCGFRKAQPQQRHVVRISCKYRTPPHTAQSHHAERSSEAAKQNRCASTNARTPQSSPLRGRSGIRGLNAVRPMLVKFPHNCLFGTCKAPSLAAPCKNSCVKIPRRIGSASSDRANFLQEEAKAQLIVCLSTSILTHYCGKFAFLNRIEVSSLMPRGMGESKPPCFWFF